MTDFLLEALNLPLFQRALIAGILVSLACGIIGSFVVVKRISSISGGLSHAAFGGVGLGYLLGFSPLAGAFGFCLTCALLLAVVYFRRRENLDTLISMLWSLGMALGMIFISLAPGYTPDLSGYLFGSIIFVPADYLRFCVLLDAVILVIILLYFKRFQAVAFDEEYSEVSGLPVQGIFIVLLLLSAVTVVMLIRIAGVILTIALLTTPAVIAQQWSTTLREILLRATCISLLGIVGGLFFAYWLSSRYLIELPTGPVIILLLSSVYIVSSVCRWLASRGRLE